MAKKKKAATKRDARGYATTTTARPSNKSKQLALEKAGKASRTVEITSKAYNELLGLLDELKKSFIQSSKASKGPIVDVSIDNKPFVKKVNFLNETLQELKFTDEQIKMVLEALILGEGISRREEGENENVLSLDAALDWLCFNLQSNDLPKLFTDVNLCKEESDGTLSIIKNIKNKDDTESKEGNKSEALKEKEAPIENIFDHISDKNLEVKDVEIMKEKADVDEAAKRSLLLQQYQFEAADEEDLDLHMDEPSAKITDQSINGRQKFPEEIQLERLEEQICEQNEDLNNDANNYMRSKHEIAQMKKSLKLLQNKARKLRAKVAKQLASLDSAVQDDDINEQETENNDDDGCAASLLDGFFDSNGGNHALNDESSSAQEKIYIEVEISSDWSGKTPKVMLYEHCQKKKIPKPTFRKVEDTGNGCIVKVDGRVIVDEGPFHSFKDAEHYVATKALYKLNPDLQIYLLLPPSFRQIWLSWLEEAKAEQLEALTEENKSRDDATAALINHLSKVVKLKDSSQSESVTFSNIPEITSDTLGDWDDASLSSGSKNNDPKSKFVAKKCSPSWAGEKLRDSFLSNQKKRDYKSMFESRKLLPIFGYRKQILDTIRNNAVTVLCTETGAGKTTQCPQFILEEALLSGFGDTSNILCTQPRRISALSVAERVAEEMCDPIGKRVGYHIRMEAKKTKDTKLLFCTTGVVLRRLQDDPNLTGVTHVIVDEVHERQWQIDFLLIALRRLLYTTRRTDLKVILMSATLDSKLFCSFFQNAPFLSIPGRTFPVSEYYLEDILDATDHIIEEDSRHAIKQYYEKKTTSVRVTGRGGERRLETLSLEHESDLMEVSDEYEGYKMSTRRSMERVDEQVINYDLIEDLLMFMLDKDKNDKILLPDCNGISQSSLSNGSILIFLPGLGEIRALNDRLQGNIHFGNVNLFDIIPMHSTLSPKDQKRAFMKPKAGCQKIILATNIAETSITIDDCICVIDTGSVREIVQDKRSLTSKLVTMWCSKASSKQRAGRAGRVQPGICCKLYSSSTANNMKKQSIPELQRVPLEEVCLNILAGNLANNCMEFLSQAPQPPSNEAVANALKVLEEVNAIEPMKRKNSDARVEIMTPLGEHLAKLPVHVRVGKMLIFGVVFKVLDKILTIAASLSSKSPFSASLDQSMQAAIAHRAFGHQSSDFLTISNVWEKYWEVCKGGGYSDERRFCDKNFLNRAALIEIKDARKQFITLLGQIGFIDISKFKSVDYISTSVYNSNGSNDDILGAAICAGLYPNCAHAVVGTINEPPTLWHKQEQLWFHKSSVNYQQKKFDSEWLIFHEKFATHKSFVTTTCLVKPFSLLLFGKSISVKHLERKVIVDGWIELKIPAQTGVMFRELREKLSEELSKYISLVGESQSDMLVDGIVQLITLE